MCRCVWSRNIKNRRSIYIYDISSLRVNENPSSGNRVVPCGQTDGQTDMTTLIVAFRNFCDQRLKTGRHALDISQNGGHNVPIYSQNATTIRSHRISLLRENSIMVLCLLAFFFLWFFFSFFISLYLRPHNKYNFPYYPHVYRRTLLDIHTFWKCFTILHTSLVFICYIRI